jgi:hypothetical protein
MLQIMPDYTHWLGLAELFKRLLPENKEAQIARVPPANL